MKIKIFFLLTVLMAICHTAIAYDFSVVVPSGQTLFFNIISGNTVEVTREKTNSPYYTTYPSGDLVIPATVTFNDITYNVTQIGAYAFLDCSSLTSVTIPDGVTSIGQHALQSCTGLTSVTIPDGVTSIGQHAFQYCTGLTSVTIPDGVTSVGNAAFHNCSGLTTVTIPDGITTIGTQTFFFCSSLTSVIIPPSVTSIGFEAFAYCSSLASVTIPDGVISIGSSAFYNVRHIEYHGTATGASWGAISINGMTEGDFVYSDESKTVLRAYIGSATEVTIPASVIWIGYRAFFKCSNLISVTIPDGVTSIGRSAFEYCTALTLLNIPNSVTSIESNAFYDVRHIEYHGTATGAPWGANSMNGVIDGDFVYTDENKTMLEAYLGTVTEVTIPSTVTGIGDNALRGCGNLTSVIIPNGVTSIGQSAFERCYSLTSVTIPEGVTSIDQYTFLQCSSLTSVTIPEGITSIGIGAFTNCTSLTEIYSMSSVPPTLGINVFSGVNSSIPVYVPCSAASGYNGWGGFSNIQEEFSHTLTVASNNNNWGTAEMTTTPNCSTAATLTATPSCGYRFVQWQNANNETVSTDAEYTFTVTQDTTLTAVFSDKWTDVCSTGQTLVYTVDCNTHTATVKGYTGTCTGNLDIPATVTFANSTYNVIKIGKSAFEECGGLTAVTIPEGVIVVDTDAFIRCPDLTSVSIPNSAEYLLSGAFAFCPNLISEVNIPANLYILDNDVFKDSRNITGNVTISEGCLYVGKWSFHDCSHIDTIFYNADSTYDGYPEYNPWSGYYTGWPPFGGCTGVKCVVIGSTSRVIAHDMFRGCSGLQSIISHATVPPRLGENVFPNVPTDIPVYVPCGTVSAYQSAACWSMFTNIQEDCGSPQGDFCNEVHTIQSPSDQMLTYEIDCETQTATLTGYVGVCRGLLVIPPYIRLNGVIYVVVAIGPSAFEGNTGLLRVMIPGTVDAIYESAFKGCTNLAKVEGWYRLRGLE